MKAIDVARYFLLVASSLEAGDTISNLKMQKMLYYAQGWHFAHFNTPLFDDEIEAWKHGPVVRQVYNEFKKYGRDAISFDELDSFDKNTINSDEQEFITFVFKRLSRISAWELAELTHKEPPYKDNFVEAMNNNIPKDEIKNYFCTKLNEQIIKQKEILFNGTW